MLDINFIKNNTDLVKKAVKEKQLETVVNVDKLVSFHDEYIKSLQVVENKRSDRNKISSSISKVQGEERQSLIEQATTIKKEIKELEEGLDSKKEAYESILKKVPNVISEDTPIGKDDTENVVARQWGKLPEFNFEPRDHVELGESLDIIDIETASKVTGSRFYYLKNEAVILQQAIINYVYSVVTDKKIVGKLAKQVGNKYDTPFSPVLPPLFVKSSVMDRMARLHPIDERYYFEKDDMVLIGSAEHTLGPMHMDETLDIKKLPIRYIGFSPAFRRESGTYGKDTRGILRVHHFDKLEMESFAKVEDGLAEQKLIVAIQEYMLQQLEVPHQVVKICTGDMGKPDFRQIDMECFMPGQNKYRETHTSDYMTDYQARRLNTTYIDTDGNRQFVHMNDATAFALGRIIIAVLENNQQEDGSIIIPKVLQKYTGFKKIEL